MFRTLRPLAATCLFASALCAQLPGPLAGGPFRRIATFPVFENTDVDLETVAEIVAAADGGNLLVYTDGQTENLGFVDITDPANPVADGVVALGGEPTSVAVRGGKALVCVNTSVDFVDTSGDLLVVDVATRTIDRAIPLGGQPDAIAVSRDGRYAVVAIENERDEDLGDGEPPQAPGGFVVIVDLVGPVADWSTRTVVLDGVPDLFPSDPEPEFVDVNAFNVAAVSLQENNHVVYVDLFSGIPFFDYSAGTVDLVDVDVEEEDVIDPSGTLLGVPREPDAIAWIGPFSLATADEGDLFGGSRGFTVFGPFGTVAHEAGNTLEDAVIQLGHYPDGRSENKGNEPEGIEYGRYGTERFLFVGSERSSVVFVYELSGPSFDLDPPVLRQILPTGVAPEGLLAIPERDLFVVASEADDRGAKIRSSISIYERSDVSTYPTVISDRRADTGLPIGWGALSALATTPLLPGFAVTLHDSFYDRSRLYLVDLTTTPARIRLDLELNDDQGVLLAALNGLATALPATATADFDPASIVNADGSLRLDGEGLSIVPGGFWIASEGAGNLESGVSDPDDRPFESPNMLVKVDLSGTVVDVVFPPQEVTENQLRFGFEGVAAVGDVLYVAFQREWSDAGDPAGLVRIGRYDTVLGEWTFVHYPLETPTSPNGGWVGLSEITWLGGDEFAVVERDDQAGPDATIKLVTTFSTTGVTFRPAADVATFDVLTKTIDVDLLATDVYGPTGGFAPEKLEGLALLPDGRYLAVNDNDGVDDNSGETQLIVFD